MRIPVINTLKNVPKKRILISLLLVVLVIAIGFLMIAKIQAKKDAAIAEDLEYQEIYEEDENLIRYGGKWYKQNSNLTTLLLIGVDDFALENETAKQADFLLLVAIDEINGTYKALQINRDTMTDVKQLDMYGEEYGTKNQQIALSYSHSNNDLISCRNTVDAVSNLLYGTKIDHYVCASMDIVSKINDAVGGVPVFVVDDFSNIDPSIKQGETVTLMGDQALHFVRARSSMEEPTNLARMQRQRDYISALHAQAIKKVGEDSEFITSTLINLSSSISSDCGASELAKMFDAALMQGTTDIITLKGKATKGTEYMEFLVDEESLQNQIVEMFFVETEK